MSNKDIETFFTKLGKHIESIDEFDYDHFTDIWKKLPKIIKKSLSLISYGRMNFTTL